MWFPSLFAPRVAKSSRTRPITPRLTVEALEDRTVPSSLAPVSPPGAVAGIVGTPAAQSFQVSGSFAFSDNKVGTLSGQEATLGSFTGSFGNNNNGDRVQGTAVFSFGSGLLRFSYDVRLDRVTNQFVGTYQIVGGTDALANAAGSGSITIDHAAAGNFSMSGTISL
jgi:hypothetical protein